MDALLQRVQADSEKNQIVRPCPVRMRLGMVTNVAKVIEYYIPERFRESDKWIPSSERGKVIPFPVPEKKSA